MQPSSQADTTHSIEVGTIADLEVLPELTREHYEEIATEGKLQTPDFDWPQFRNLEAIGLLLVLIARVRGEVVGYSVTILVPSHIHYRWLAFANNDLLFVRKSARRRGIGKRLIARTQDDAAHRGFRHVVWHAKPGTALEAVLHRMGYRVEELTMMKEL